MHESGMYATRHLIVAKADSRSMSGPLAKFLREIHTERDLNDTEFRGAAHARTLHVFLAILLARVRAF